mmetsp:Transcript_9820/g.24238  ORF Transcript_9820/g.24238 Transcript_9820/m.24238 type:complete len:594 (-) Transcript_9820:573-2354(-)
MLGRSRHFRTAFSKTPLKQWLPQNADLFSVLLRLWNELDFLEKQTLTMGRRDPSLVERLKASYPLLSVCTKFTPQQAIACRNGFEALLGSVPPVKGNKKNEEVPRELIALQRQVACPMGCGVDVIDHQLAIHKLKLCKKRNAECELGCGAKLVYEQMEEHCSMECPNRGVICPMCHEVVLAKDLGEHSGVCTHRPTQCEKCDATFPLIQQESHNASCPQRKIKCNWCSQSVIASVLLDPHKEVECAARFERAKKMNDAIYMCRSLAEIAGFLDDGVLPTAVFSEQELEARGVEDVDGTIGRGIAPSTSEQQVVAPGSEQAGGATSSSTPTARGKHRAGSGADGGGVSRSPQTSPSGRSLSTRNRQVHGQTSSPLGRTSQAVEQLLPISPLGRENSIELGFDGFCRSNFVGLGLHAAAVVDAVDIAQLLLKRGADLYAADRFGRTALHVAAAYGSPAVLDALLVEDAERQSLGVLGARSRNRNSNSRAGNGNGKNSTHCIEVPEDHMGARLGGHSDTTTTPASLADYRDDYGRTALFLAGFHQRKVCVDLLYDVSPYTPRTEKQCDALLNVLRYDARKEKTFAYLKEGRGAATE